MTGLFLLVLHPEREILQGAHLFPLPAPHLLLHVGITLVREDTLRFRGSAAPVLKPAEGSSRSFSPGEKMHMHPAKARKKSGKTTIFFRICICRGVSSFFPASGCLFCFSFVVIIEIF